MTTTNLAVIKSALGLLGVLTETETPTAEQSAHALEVLNDFLEDWTARGIDIGQWPQTDLTVEVPVPGDTVAVAKHTLAIHLSPYYGREPSAVTVMFASAGFDRLLRNAIVAQLEPADMSHLHRGAGNGDVESILTG